MSPEQAQDLVALADGPLLEEAARHLVVKGPLQTRAWLDSRGLPAQACLAILDCAACRSHFVTKFEHPERWLLTRSAAEQATASVLARWRSDYLRGRLPDIGQAIELGTGLGGDSVYLARNFRLQGYEQEPARAILARANVTRLNRRPVEAVIEEKQVEVGALRGGLLFADPARRGATRKFAPESWEPPFSSILGASGVEAIVVKTAPGIDLSVVPAWTEVHFLSISGDLKEAMLLRAAPFSASTPRLDRGSPDRLAASIRHAWRWDDSRTEPYHRSGEESTPGVRDPRPGEFLHNPDPALLRSGLLGDLASELRAGLVHPKIGYLCGPLPSPDGWATSFAIRDSFPLQWKGVNAALTATDWSDFEYLARGVPFTQAELLERTRVARKRMKSRAGGRGALVIYRDQAGYRAVLAVRVPSE